MLLSSGQLEVCELPLSFAPTKIGPGRLPSIETPADISKAYDQIWSAVGAGEITLDEMERLSAFLEAKQKAIESVELVARLEKIGKFAELST